MIEAEVSETEALVEAWKAIIGLIFVLVVLFMPRGLGGVAHDVLRQLVRRFKPSASSPSLQQQSEAL
ncbi:hypothetical protein D3C86_1520670 [compost metagenome]